MIYIIIFLAIILYIVYLYNKLVTLNTRLKNALAQIDNQLKRRADLIPNLVEVVKGYSKHELETLVGVVNARNKAITIPEKAKNSEDISKSLKSVFALTESYPDLKSNEAFLNLQIELTGTEDKIAFARQFYNDTVQHYNTAIQKFPTVILANIMKCQEKEYFKVNDEDKESVKIEL